MFGIMRNTALQTAFAVSALLSCRLVVAQLPDIEQGTLRVDVDLVVASNAIEQPVLVTNAGDGSDRLFVVDRFGPVSIVQDHTLLPAPFLDLTEEVVSNGPRGLLGMVFHPDFADDQAPGYRKLYTYHSAPADGTPVDFNSPGTITHHNVLTEWQVSDSDPNEVDVNTRREIFRYAHPEDRHSGGDLHFDSSDYLHISIGTSKSQQAQNLGNLLGSMLRIDPLDPALTAATADPVSANGRYRIPVDNPFRDDMSALDEIYAYGLRHPYRFSIDADTGVGFIGDVGEAKIEEVDVLGAGKNYGWPYFEGTLDGPSSPPDPLPAVEPPLAQYDQDDGRSVIGGFVYRGSDIPELDGTYVFGDLTRSQGSFFSQSGRLFWLDPYDENQQLKDPSQVEIQEFIIGLTGDDPGLTLLGFGMDEQGEIYMAGFGTVDGLNDNMGTVMKIVPFVPLLGDMDCDGDVDFDDIDAFVLGLNNPADYEAQFGVPPSLKGDEDGDGDQDFDDITGFVQRLTGPPSETADVPEPGLAALLGSGLMLLVIAAGRGQSCSDQPPLTDSF